MTTNAREIRPNRRVFVIRSVFRTGLFTFPLVLAATAFAPTMELGGGLGFGAGLAIWIALVLFRFVQRTVIYGKTRYLLHPDRIVLESGGLLSERSVDLQFTNVTRVGLVLPFIENRLYETGHVTVEAAGSAAAEIVLESIDEPGQIFDDLTDALRHNGFSLARGELVQQEKPGFVGSLYELGAPVVTSFFVLLFVIPDLLEAMVAVAEVADVGQLIELVTSGELMREATEISVGSILAGLLLVVGSMAGAVAFVALKWMDILRRTYTLHDDVIDYTDGFLTRKHSFIPVENLTDVEIDQKLVQRILSISTIKVSCQGAGVDIRLGAVPNGQQFKANLERLIDESGPVRPAAQSVEHRDDEASGFVDVGRSAEEPPPSLPRVEGAYDWKRGLVGPVAAFLVSAVVAALGMIAGVAVVPDLGIGEAIGIYGLIALIGVLSFAPRAVKIAFQAYALDYAVDERKVTHTYDLLSRKQTEFTVDKISAIEIRRSPLDRWMKTAKVVFTSIGSTEKITFENLANADAVIDAVLARLRIDRAAVRQTHAPNFSLGSVIRAVDPLVVLFLLGVPASLVGAVFVPLAGIALAALSLVAAVVRVVFLKLFCDRAALDRGDNWLRFGTGIIVRKELFIPSRQVRGIDARENVGEPRGVLSVRSGGGAAGQLGYLDGVWELQQQLDAWLHGESSREALDTQVATARSPAVFNALVRLVGVSLLVMVPAPLLPFTIPWTVVATRRVEYQLQGSRVVRLSGVFRRRRHTILLQRIDHLTTSRGPLNRINDTGSIGVVTLGSSGTDMLVKDVTDHQGFYETIESMTKRHLGSSPSN